MTMNPLFFLFVSLVISSCCSAQNAWTELTSSTPVSARTYPASIYVSSSNSMLIFGGYGSSNLNDLWSYNISSNSWIQLNASNPPPVRNSDSAIYISSSNSMLIFGGCNCPIYFRDLWNYSISSNSWTQLTPSNPLPSTRKGQSGIYVSSSNSMLIFGGSGASGALLNDLWSYNISSNSWTQLNSSNPPPARYGHSGIYVPSSNSMLIFGGNGASGILLNDLWNYSISSNSWTQLTPSNSPPVRYGHSGVYESPLNSMIIFGGYSDSNGGVLNDTWTYDISSGSWIQLTPSNSPPARTYHSGIYAASSNSMLIFGGFNGEGSDFNDLWEFTTVALQTTVFQQTTQQQTTQQQTTQQQTTQQTTREQTTQQQSIKPGMSEGELIGITLLIAVLVLIIIFLVIYFTIKWKRRRNSKISFRDASISLENRYTSFEIESLVIETKIGSGSFGEVYRGKFGQMTVACKKLINDQLINEEITILKSVKHPNIVEFLGIKELDGVLYIIMEFMNNGNLLEYVRTNKQQIPEVSLKDMAYQIAFGMTYLEEKKIIHRDLALRNVLCNIEFSKITCKISDFGLSKLLPQYYNYYKPVTKSTPLPIKWSAPEVVLRERVSVKSDVFSYGVVLFELFSFGEIPWAGLSNEEVVIKLREGKRMTLPDNFGPQSILELINQCWQEEPHQRPDFQQIVGILGQNKDLYS